MSQVNHPHILFLCVLAQFNLIVSLNSVNTQNFLSESVNTNTEQTTYIKTNENKLSKDPPPNKTNYHQFKSQEV